MPHSGLRHGLLRDTRAANYDALIALAVGVCVQLCAGVCVGVCVSVCESVNN